MALLLVQLGQVVLCPPLDRRDRSPQFVAEREKTPGEGKVDDAATSFS